MATFKHISSKNADYGAAEQYLTFEHDAWEQAVNGKGKTKPQQKPPERESIRKNLRDLEVEAKRRNAERRQESRHRSYDYDRGR